MYDELTVYHRKSKAAETEYDDLEAGLYLAAFIFITLIFAILVKYLGKITETHLQEVEPNMQETEMMKRQYR